MNEKECPIPEPFSRMVGNILFVTGLFFLTFIGRFVFAPLMPTIEQDMGLSHSQAGSLFLMVSLGVFSASLMSGFVSNRFKHRGSLFLSNIGVGIALISIYFITSLLSLIHISEPTRPY